MRSQWSLFRVAVALFGAAAAGAVTNPASAGETNPTLSALVQGINDEHQRRNLPIADLRVDVQIFGTIVRTTVEARFANPVDDVLEGQLSLALPEAAAVTGYALDVEGQFIHGVLSEPSRARAVYEEQVRGTIDPGIGEVSRANVFSTRVYPVSQEGRAIRLTFVAPIHARSGWHLPLATADTVSNVAFTFRAEEVATAPNLELPSGLQAQWRRDGNAFTATATLANQPLSGELRVGPVAASKKLLTSVHPATGRRFFQLTDAVAMDAGPRASPARLRIYWDRSLSRKDDALSDEMALIERYVSDLKPRAVDVVLFNSSDARVSSFTSAAEAVALLKSVKYAGGTSFATLQETKVPAAPLCLMFSDGVSTIDRRDSFQPDCELFAITTAEDPDLGYLAGLMKGSTNAVLRLDRTSSEDVLYRLRYRAPAVLEIFDIDGTLLPHASLPAPRGEFAVIAEAPRSGKIVVRIGGSGGAEIERAYSMGGRRASFDGAGGLWAAERVLQLAASEKRTDMKAVARRYSVASPYMSFVVLETPWQYVEAKLTPPSGFPKEWMEEYLEARTEQEHAEKQARRQRLDVVARQWEEQKAWWAWSLDPSAPEPERLSPRGRFSIDWDLHDRLSNEGNLLQEVSVTGNRIVKRGATIELAPWDLDRPYLKALNAAGPNEIETVFAEQEEAHGNLPAFYFDVAEWFHRRGETPRAVEVVLSALELPLKNDETLIVVADRLTRYGQPSRAVWLYEQLIELAPDRPQPRRSLALALAERAKNSGAHSARRDLTRAVTLLNEVVMTPWSDEYAGIELVSLMEANALLPKLRKIGGTDMILDERLIAPLQVDLRVVIEWNTAATDLDLWVTEPSGEQSMYANALTESGGRLSNDMTSGYGPEEYLLRRAAAGEFSVGVRVYSTDRLNPNGVTTVSARLIHDFGRATERSETIDLDLGADAEGEIALGKFVLEKSGAFAAVAAPEAEEENSDE